MTMRKKMPAFTLLSLTLLLSACGERNDPFTPTRPMIGGQAVPAANQAHDLEPEPVFEGSRAPAALPPGDFPAAVAIRDLVPVSAPVNKTGLLRHDRKGIHFEAYDGSSIVIPYRLPREMPPPTLPPTGRLELYDLSNMGGARMKILLTDDGEQPLFVHIWETSRIPMDIQIGQGLRLIQLPPENQVEPGHFPATLAIIEHGRTLGNITPGQTATLQTSAGTISVTPEISVLAVPAPGVQDPDFPHYILRAWVTGGLPPVDGGDSGQSQIRGDNMQAAPTNQ